MPTLDEIVSACARRWPELEAIAWRDQTLRYRELEERATAIAEGLVVRGVGPGDSVGLCLGVGADRVAGLLGIFKAGAASVPLDPKWPAERLEHVLADSDVRCVLVDGGTAAAISGTTRWNLEDSPPTRASVRLPAPHPERVAYVVYTSGSTGEPKGVRVPHRGVVNVCQHVAKSAALGPGARVHQFTPIVFDAAMEAIFAPLTAGATVVLAEEQAVSPAEFTALVRAQRLTYLSLPPLFLREWIDYLAATGQRVPTTVSWVCLGGDRIPTALWHAWAAVGGGHIPWANDYGPTEASITATRFEYRGEPLAQEHLPIGKPITNVRAYVLSPEGSPVPDGEVGELHLAGVCLAHGYSRRPDATAERFVPDPFAPEPNARMYRTGDLVRRHPDGVSS